MISIHAAREGGDAGAFFEIERGKISIHAAREGGDSRRTRHLSRSLTFQSTPPVKAATQFVILPEQVVIISIHAAREGGD